MAKDFGSAVAELWRAMGLEPVAPADETLELECDGFVVRLVGQDDGDSLLVSAEIGPLAQDPATRAGQIRKILTSNFGLLASKRACVHFRSAADDPPILAASGRHLYRNGHQALSSLIDDVLFVHQWHADEISGSGPGAGFMGGDLERNDFIFRP